MKTKKIAGLILTSMCLVLALPLPTLADASKVVTLGADLTEEQRIRMLNYFKVDPNNVRIITVTNQDERNHLASYVPMEQIGNYTVSSAYVNPTMSGGIKVRTANLNWVTSNRIAATLSTSGVTNCEVIAAAPFEVSGTGALTGVIMAYEAASGEVLDAVKKELATEEMFVTGELGDEIGSMEATAMINEAKMQVIGENVQAADEIYNIVNNIVANNDYQVSDEKLDEIVGLLNEIANQDYDYEDMKETLERVEENVSESAAEELENNEYVGEEITGYEDRLLVEDEGILEDLDESILGENVIASSTDQHEWENPVNQETDEEWETYDEEWDILDEDSYSDDDWDIDDSMDAAIVDTDIDDMELDGEDSEEALDDELMTTDQLDPEQKMYYDQAELFCEAAYQGDEYAKTQLQDMGLLSDTAQFDASWSFEEGENLTKQVLDIYLSILLGEGNMYEAQDDDYYISPEMNLLDRKLRSVFGVETGYPEGALEGANVSYEECFEYYEYTLKFFADLYGETDDMDEETLDYETYASETYSSENYASEELADYEMYESEELYDYEEIE